MVGKNRVQGRFFIQTAAVSDVYFSSSIHRGARIAQLVTWNLEFQPSKTIRPVLRLVLHAESAGAPVE